MLTLADEAIMNVNTSKMNSQQRQFYEWKQKKIMDRIAKEQEKERAEKEKEWAKKENERAEKENKQAKKENQNQMQLNNKNESNPEEVEIYDDENESEY
jgi:hypothetical protein